MIEFEAKVTAEGTIVIPRHVAKTLEAGTAVVIRLTKGGISNSLRDRGVTEDEIEHIAALQLEPRENVVRFLQTEGTLSTGHAFQRRVSNRAKRRS